MNCQHFLVSGLLIFALLAGCSQKPQRTTSSRPTPTQSSEAHHHEHEAPHNGTLIVLGEEFAHLEFVLDSEKGELTVYVLDGEASNPVKLESGSLTLNLTQPKQEALVLSPVADKLTGETVESTSKFSANSEVLRGVTTFKGTLQSLTVKGREFSGVKVTFPEGNESHEKHHEGDHH